MLIRCCAIIFALLLTGSVSGQLSSVRGDSATVELRTIPEENLEEYRALKEYDYGIEKGGSLWEELKREFKRRLNEMLRGEEAESAITLIAIVLVVIGLLIFVLNNNSAVFGKRDSEKDGKLEVFDEEVDISSIGERISGYEKSGEYSEAYRWRYVDLLSVLDAQGIIRARGYKTNGNYQYEVKRSRSALAEPFSKLATEFDFTHYGDYPVGEEKYNELRSVIEQLKRSAGA